MRVLTLLVVAGSMVLGTGDVRAEFGEQLFKLLADDGEAWERFGSDVAVSNDLAVVGATYDEDNGFRSGSAYLFDAVTGQPFFKLLPDDGAANDYFGRAVSISNDIVLVGAIGGDDSGSGSGSAYLFDAVTGQQLLKLLPDDGAANDYFGRAVAISSDLVVVGAVGDDDNGSFSGSAYLFDVDTGQQLFKLLPSDGTADDNFGRAVAISNDLVVVGARYDDDNGADSGSAYLFDAVTGQQVFKLLPGDGTSYDNFGRAVAISDDVVVVGATGDGDNGHKSGSAYLFDAVTGQQIFKLLADDGAAWDSFGYSVAISGHTVVVGALGDDDNGNESGSAYLFDVATGQQIFKLLADDGTGGDSLGARVAISNDRVIAGASSDDDNGLDSGSAYLFDLVLAVLYVDDDAPPNGNGTSWDTAYRFLSDALGAAESNASVNQIRIAQGLYLPDRSEATPGGSGNRSASFELIDGLELRGGYAGIGAPNPNERDVTLYESVLSGDLLQDNEPDIWNLFWSDNSYHVVEAIETIPASTLNGLTITEGNADGQEDDRGGGVALIDGALNVVDCLFMYNRASCDEQIVARGGAIWSASSTLNVTRGQFMGNRVTSSNQTYQAPPPGGGAIAASASSVTLMDCEFWRNRISSTWSCKGAALWAATGAEIEMTNCSFRENIASSVWGTASGGAVLLSSATATATNCVYSQNRSGGYGGLKYNGSARGGAWSIWNSTASFESCQFVDTEVYGEGGAIGGVFHNVDSTLQFIDCLISGTDISSGVWMTGVVMYIEDTSVTLVNTLIAFNDGWEGGAINHEGSGTITIVNSVLWGNRGGGPSQTIEEQQLDAGLSHVDINYSCVEGWTGVYGGAGNHGLDPLFVDPVGLDGDPFTAFDNNYRLLSGSPCIDAGDNSATDSETDLDGNDRFVDDPNTEDTGVGTPPIIDMGPYEGPFEIPPDPCPMDLNDNGAVDFQDLLVLLGAWNNPYSFVDLVELLATWGECP